MERETLSTAGAASLSNSPSEISYDSTKLILQPWLPSGVSAQSPWKCLNGPSTSRTCSHSGRRFGLRVWKPKRNCR